jgi:prepilin-type N-terminal cleavage/methylation domain-containing protein
MGAPLCRRHAGFSLAELLVAVTLLSVGALALAGTAAAVLRLLAVGGVRAAAAVLVESHLELVRATRCTPSAGADTVPGVVARWRVQPLGGGVAELRDSLRIRARGTGGVWGEVEPFRSGVLC